MYKPKEVKAILETDIWHLLANLTARYRTLEEMFKQTNYRSTQSGTIRSG